MGFTKTNPLLVILGPTASGKTALAAQAAFEFNGEVISADSRQIYKGMDLGTGKDLNEYLVKGIRVPLHLVDTHEPGYKYNVFEYQTDFLRAYEKIQSASHLPVMCGGSGMYIQAVVEGYRLIQVPVNDDFRNTIANLNNDVLAEKLRQLKPLHNTSDITSRKRLVRALEIAEFEKNHPGEFAEIPPFNAVLVGVLYPRSQLRERITSRLKQRLSEGMVEEVQHLLNTGISPEDLMYYGLEYKFITQYLIGQLDYDMMFQKLNTAIHQFAKRQMTWFRKMEREGNTINWVDGNWDLELKLEKISSLIAQHFNINPS